MMDLLQHVSRPRPPPTMNLGNEAREDGETGLKQELWTTISKLLCVNEY